jgi:hypothetical protein
MLAAKLFLMSTGSRQSGPVGYFFSLFYPFQQRDIAIMKYETLLISLTLFETGKKINNFASVRLKEPL